MGTPSVKPVPLLLVRPVASFGADAFFAVVLMGTIENLGLATTSWAGSDHDICCAPVGSE